VPLLFDMPVEQLPSYRGRNPRPQDHDEYWARALTELEAQDDEVELQPADFHADFAECHHLWFSGVRGARVHAKLLRPKSLIGKGPAVLMFHGYSGNAGDWVDKLGYVAQGFTVAALDCRGQGGLSEDSGGHLGTTRQGHIIRGLAGPPDDMLYRQIFLDTAQLARIVMDMPQVDAGRVCATGGSQGGALTIACAALEPRIFRAAPVFPFLSDYLRVWELDLDENAYGELRTWFRHFDPLHERERDVFTQLGYIDIQHLAPRIRAEVLMGTGLMDQICPPSTQYAAFNRIASPKSVRHYPDYGHETLPGHQDAIFGFLAE